MKKYLLLSTFIVLGHMASAQSVMDGIFNQLVPVDSLPSTLRSGKTLVLLDAPGNDEENWLRICKELHTEIIKGGIDPVVYYDPDLVFSGWDIKQSFIGDFIARELDNVLLLQFREERSRLAIFEFNEDFFQGEKQMAWIRTGSLETISNQAYVSASNSGMELSNLLISEIPETGGLTDPITGKRAEYFSLAMNGTTLAVPRMGNPLQDQELHAVMQQFFEYDFELVDPNISDEELNEMGYRFILRFVKGPAKTIRKLLEYEEEEGVTGYVAIRYAGNSNEAITHSLDDIVYKFYMKNVGLKTTFLGAEWDVDLNWRQALVNHLQSMKKYTSR